MDETQGQSPKVCFSPDSYLVYGIRRDSQGGTLVRVSLGFAVFVMHEDEGWSYGVSFPDVPCCIVAGDTLPKRLPHISR